MFDNIGSKIKTLAKVVCIISIIAFLALGIYYIAEYNHEEELIIGIIYVLLGPVVSYLGVLVLYGFGELIEKTSEIKNNTDKLVKNSFNANYTLDKTQNNSVEEMKIKNYLISQFELNENDIKFNDGLLVDIEDIQSIKLSGQYLKVYTTEFEVNIDCGTVIVAQMFAEKIKNLATSADTSK